MRVATAALGVLVSIVGASVARAAPDPFAWTPRGAPGVVRGREAGSRFGLLSLHEITVEIDNVFAAANRQALGLAQQRLAQIPGVRNVYGPAGLLDISVDASGKTRARAVMARGASEAEGEAARQRIVRRADALGWFLTENGRQARFLVDTDDWEHVAPKVTAALVTAGLGLASASAETFQARPLWPDPRERGRFLPAELAAAWVFFVLLAARRARLDFAGAHDLRRRLGRAFAVALGASAPFAVVPIGGVAALGGLAALAAAVVTLAGALGGGGPPAHWSRALPRRVPSRALVVVAAVVAAAGFSSGRRLRVTTRQWSAAPMFFVSVRADFDEPVVLREVRRLADELRAQPGVANAWSVADLFTGVAFPGEEPSRIPDDADEVRRILVQARTDPAVALELAGDHREALVAVRFDGDPTVDHQAVLSHLERYLGVEMRRSLAHVDLGAPGVTPDTRAFGQGMLALDARERVLRICDRSGRALGPAEAQAVERAARQAATIPAADPTKLDAEVSDVVRSFIVKHPFPLPAAELARLRAAIVALGDRATPDEVRVAVAAAYGPRLPDAILRSTAATLARQVASVRRRLVARTAFREMLFGADLPTEGVLADEVRGATAEAMGPVVGLPVGPELSGAFKLDAVPIGGAVNDRALSTVWARALPAGLGWAGVMLAILLVWIGGAAGLASLPLALAPLAAATTPAALLGEPVGLPALAFFAGALAGGAALAFAATAPAPVRAARRRQARGGTAAAVAGLVLLFVSGCGAPPWRMGAPLDGRPSIPPRQARHTAQEARAAAAAARAAGQPALEIPALGELDALDRLEPAERSRLAALLSARAAAFHDLGRAIPESADLETAARLVPSLGPALAARRAAAAVAAGDAWKAIGAIAEARSSYARASALGGVPPDGPPPAAVPVLLLRPPADIQAWVLSGPALSAQVLPLVAAFPWVLDDQPRALGWAPLLLDEDPTSPDVRALVALIFGRAGRLGGTERMLMELTYYSPDRAAALGRGAVIWERLGRPREACAQWVRAARYRDDPEDPTWVRAVTCARRDPGAADWREIRTYVLARAQPDRRPALAVALDGTAAPSSDGGADAADARVDVAPATSDGGAP